MSWHAEPQTLARYASGDADDVTALSVEAHLLACARCRADVAWLVDAGRLERVWSGIGATLDAPRPAFVERMLTRIGVPDHIARLLAATPSLSLPWLAAVVLSLGFAAAGAHVDRDGAVLFLALAPLLPLAGIAAAYGALDPASEVGLAAPMRSFRLLLVRSVAVLVTTTALAGLAGLAVPGLGGRTAAWLLPALALSACGLAFGTFLPSVRACAAVAFAWIAAVLVAAAAERDRFAAFEPEGQLVCLGVAVLATAVLVRRREALDRKWPA